MKLNAKTKLEEANTLLKQGRYEEAEIIYKELMLFGGMASKLAELNITFLNNLRNLKISHLESVSSYDFNLDYKIAVVFHVFHPSIINEILDSFHNIKFNFDLFVTSPLERSSSAIQLIFDRYPNTNFTYCVNKGRDILPFLIVFDKIKDYDLCLKIHTKQGLTNFGDLWRNVAMQSLLKTETFVSDIIGHFRLDDSISIAGPKDFYVSGRGLLYGNHGNVTDICQLLDFEYEESREWAFFAGSMFWFKPEVYLDYIEQLKSLKFGTESGRQDGGVEHAVERIFGLIPSYTDRKAILLNGFENASLIEVVSLPEHVGFEDPTKHLAAISNGKLKELAIAGDINKQSAGALADLKVRGWLAKLDDDRPRKFVVRIGGQEFKGVANIYREDLEKAQIHRGCHAIEVNVPVRYMDGEEHLVSLFDQESSLPVATNKYRWNTQRRAYANFNEYLSWSYGGQLVEAPFMEEDKRSFAVMELIADNLSTLSLGLTVCPLISIIMPTYNRASILNRAIDSVLAQKYRNWELLIIDDGSTDNTEAIVNAYTDERIFYHKLQQNLGVSNARNYGIDHSFGEYVSYLDSDNTWDCRYLSAMVGAARFKLKKASSFYSGQIIFSGKDRVLTGVRFGLYNKSLLFNNNYIDLNCFMHERLLNGKVPQFDVDLKRFVDWYFIVSISESTNIASIPVLLSNYFLGYSNNCLTSDDTLLPYLDIVRSRIDILNKNKNKITKVKGDFFNEITIIIPSFEAKEDMLKCLLSIEPYLSDKYEGNFKLIVVDNKSSDDVVTLLRNFVGQHRAVATLKELDKNYGFTYAVNVGLDLVNKGSDVLLLNNDAILTGDCLFNLQSSLYNGGDYALAVPAQILPGGTPTIKDHVPYALPEYEVDVNVSVHHKNLSQPPLFYEGGVFDIEFAPFFCVLIKAETLHAAPHLDAVNGRHYRSDRSYCSYVRQVIGSKIAFCPSAMVYHGLQKSTAELKSKVGNDANNTEFRNIFIENSWTEDELIDLRTSLPLWNVTL